MAGVIVPIVFAVVVLYVIGSMVGSARKPRKGKAAPWPPYPVIDATEDEMDRRRAELRDKLSREALGAERAGRLWEKLRAAKLGEGLIHEFHRDFCGHGLIRTEAGVILCDILDGHAPGPAIASWGDERDFVDFFARQSDFTMSGWEPAEPIFFTEDKWYRNNQRLRVGIIDRFLEGAARLKDWHG